MRIIRAYKTELDPTIKQQQTFVQCCGAARYVYNWGLADRIEHRKTGTKTNHYEQRRRFNSEKHKTCPWIKELPYKLVEHAFANLDQAYKNFFRRLKTNSKPGFPRFKSRKNGLGSFTLHRYILIEPSRIRFPVIGWIRIKEHNYMPTSGVRIISVTVSEKASRWFASLQVEEEILDPIPSDGPAIGVDLGIKTLATCSDGTVFQNPHSLRFHERKLKYLQRELSRRKKGSHNREKSRRKIARLHLRIANIRKNTIHQATHYLTVKTKPSAIVIEDLNVSGMMQNKCLSKALADASFAEFSRQLKYKSRWNGIDLVVADRFYPSSKTCSACGCVKPLLRLSERKFMCEACGTTIDRDLNAALNLASLANIREDYSLECKNKAVGSTVKLVDRRGCSQQYRQCSWVKQEPTQKSEIRVRNNG